MAKNPGTKYEEWIVSSLKPYFADARRTRGSGATWNTGDVQAGPLEIEAKDRTTASVSIPKSVLERTEETAKKSGRIPIVATRCQTGNYVTMRWSDFEDMIQRLTELEEEIDSLIDDLAGEDI